MHIQPRQPGDTLLGRYFPNADNATRERAREAFRDFARALEALGSIIAAHYVDSRLDDPSGTISSLDTKS